MTKLVTTTALCLILSISLSNATEHKVGDQRSSGLTDTLSWRTFDTEPPWSCIFWSDEPPGDSVAMWFEPLAPCTLKTIRIWQRTLGVMFTIDVYLARYDGHIASRDSTNAKGWIGYNENGLWVSGWRLGHPPLGEHIWGPFPLTLLPENPDWMEIPTRLMGEPFLDGNSFFINIFVWGVAYPATFIGGEDENTIPYHFFRYFPSKENAPGRAHKGWYLLSSSLWVEAIVSYSANTPPVISDMSVRNDTYGGGPYPIEATIEDWDVESPERAGISSAYLVWDISGVIDSTLMSGPSEDGNFHGEIPSVNVDENVRYHISATDLAGARSSNTVSIFTRTAPKNPEADILTVCYERGSGGEEYLWIRSLLDSLGYQHEDWNMHDHRGIDESVYRFGWNTIFPFGRNVGKEGIYGPFPTQGYEGNIWADFLTGGASDHPASILYIPDEYIAIYENCDNDPERIFVPGDFAYDFLGLASNSCYEDTTWFLVGMDQDPLSGEFHDQPFRLVYHSPLTFKSTTARESGANLFVTQQDSTTGIRFDGGHFKTVYLPWPWGAFFSDDSTFSSSHDFLRLTKNILDWFGTETRRTGIEDRQTSSAPQDFALFQNYPNPFNPSTTISYTLPVQNEESKVKGRESLNFEPLPFNVNLKIYNILGQEVRTLVDESKEPGFYSVEWDGRDKHGNETASGVYFYRIKMGDFTSTKRMVLMK